MRYVKFKLEAIGLKMGLAELQCGHVLFVRVQVERQGEQKTAVWQVVQ